MHLNISASFASQDDQTRVMVKATCSGMPDSSYLELVSDSSDLTMNSCSQFTENNGIGTGSMIVSVGTECEVSIIKALHYYAQGRIVFSNNKGKLEYKVTKNHNLSLDVRV